MPNVSYTLTLNDMMSNKLKEADGHAEHLEHRMEQLKEKANGFGENLMEGLKTLGIGFAIFKGAEFLEKGVEAFHHMEQANAQLEAGLESTKGVAGMTMDSLTASAEKFNATTAYSRTEIKDMQAQLLTFPAVTKATFNATTEAVLNMGARTHRGINEISIMVGKAMQDPIKGISALKRVGVNFNENQKEMVQHMVATGHAAEAQKLILKELGTEFAGSSEAAFNADPLAKFHKSMESIQLSMGEAGMELVSFLAPALNGFAKILKKSVEGVITFGHWLRDNMVYVKAAAIVVGALGVAWLVENAAMITAAAGTAIMTAAQWLLNAALSANPIGIVIVAVAAFAAAIYVAYQKSAKFRAVIAGIGAVLVSTMPILKGWGEMLLGELTLNPSLVKKGFQDSLAGIQDIVKRGGISGIFNHAYDESMAQSKKGESTMGKLAKKKEGHEGAAAGGVPDMKKGKKESVTGHKSYTINIKIENLVRDFKVQTTNLTEGAGKVKDMVAQALMSAVNDSQIVAGE